MMLAPARPVAEVVSFYYDVWRALSLPRAKQWFIRKKQVRLLDTCATTLAVPDLP